MARLGTKDWPARLRVQTISRSRELTEFCKKHRWEVSITLMPFLPENITDLQTLIRQAFLEDEQIKKTGPYDPCLCGSGKKIKFCCRR